MLPSVTHLLAGPVARPLPHEDPEPDDGPPGDVHLQTRRGRLVVRFEGEIDTAVRTRFDRVLTVVRAAHEPVEVDCRDVTFFCAEGVRMLMLLQSAAGGPGVTGLRSSPWVDRALRLSGIERYPSGP